MNTLSTLLDPKEWLALAGVLCCGCFYLGLRCGAKAKEWGWL